MIDKFTLIHRKKTASAGSKVKYPSPSAIQTGLTRYAVSSLLLFLIAGSNPSFADDVLAIPKENQWKTLATIDNTGGKYIMKMAYALAPRASSYPADWVQVWLKEELVKNCTGKDAQCAWIGRYIVDCEYRPKGMVKEQSYFYDINGKYLGSDSRQKPFEDITDKPHYIKFYDRVCADTVDVRRQAKKQQTDAKAKAAAREAEERANAPKYQATLPLTDNGDGTGNVWAREAYILFEDGRQVARGATDENGDIDYPLKKDSTYILQLAHGKFTLSPVRHKKTGKSKK